MRLALPVLILVLIGAGCSPAIQPGASNAVVSIPVLENDALSWHASAYAPAILGMRLLRDGPPTTSVTLAVTRAILHTNARIGPIDALCLAGVTVRAARENGMPAEFLAATLLQESAFDPRALSSAGAVGIAQFMLSTAQAAAVDPFDPYDAIRGAARLLASYIHAYAGYPNPYTAALAAYNAGPGAVDAYHGVPPYPETHAYIDDILDRWAKITAYEAPIDGE